MDDAVGVGVGDRLADLLEDGHEPAPVGGRVRPVREQGGEGAALDQLHGQERPAVGQGRRARGRAGCRGAGAGR